MGKPVVTVGYWPCRGFAHRIQLLLEYAGVEYKTVEIESGPPPKFIKDEWMQTKHSRIPHHDYPNLPYYDDGNGVRMTHVIAIMEHLSRKHGLSPTRDDPESLWIDADMLREQLMDVARAQTAFMYFPKHRAKGTEPTKEEKLAKKAVYEKRITTLLKEVEKKVDKNAEGPFLLGKKVSYVDFFAWDELEMAKTFLGSGYLLDNGMPRLEAYMAAFEALPGVKEYFASGKFRRFPFYSARAYIGMKEGDCP